MNTVSGTKAAKRRQRWRLILMDVLLLPVALLFVIVEHVFWAGAIVLLRALSRIAFIRALQTQLERLPAWAVLPLFLIPEALSHVGGISATVLLVRHKFILAVVVGVLVKGFATLLAVWIFQSCTTTLLSVRWFAWGHHKALQGRDWVAAQIAPIRLYTRRIIVQGRSNLRRRFKAMRLIIASRLGLRPKR